MPSISESYHPGHDANAGNAEDEDMSSVGDNEIDDILDEAMDDEEEEEEEELHNYSRSPKRMGGGGSAPQAFHSPTASAASWEFQTPSNPPKVRLKFDL